MRFAGLLVGFFALSLFLMPGLTAQEKKKKDDPKAEKADLKDAKADKKDPDKKDPDKKDPDKPEKPEKPEKPAKKKEEKLEHGPVISTKIVSMKPEAANDFTIEVPVPDPQQMAQLQQDAAQLQFWQMQQMASIARSPNPQTYAQRMQSYQIQLAQRQAQAAQKRASGYGYTKKPVDVRAAENCKVRIMFPPVQYDDEGKLKKWTRKELAALKGSSKLPGYESSLEALKIGQVVDIYLAKQHGSPKDKWTGSRQQKKKKAEEDPPEPMPEQRPEVVMIVIKFEPMGR